MQNNDNNDNEDNNENQWIIVKKRKKKFIQKEYKESKIKMKGGRTLIDLQYQTQTETNFLANQNIKNNVENIINLCKNFESKQIKIEALGIGNFKSYLKPYLQFLFLKSILMNLKHLQIKYKVNIYDPVFSQQELITVRQIDSTSQQLTILDAQSNYLIYMPHCDRQLYEYVLDLRKQYKSKMIIIGNSINEYIQRCRMLKYQIPNAFRDYSANEQKLKDYKQAFNDTYIYQL